jgi:hypothetical protein
VAKNRVGRNDPCPCGSGKKYKRCCLDKKEQEIADGSPLTLMIDTDGGMIVREIPAASPLPSDTSRGLAAEGATADAAALWGLPDFVYEAATRQVGAGSREIGDRILVVGDLAVVVQVKAREAPTADAARERAWVESRARTALSQANGTIRYLQREHVLLKNLRGHTLEVGSQPLRCVATVVIDHPDVPDGITFGDDSRNSPSVVLLRRDWEFLFDQLKSIHAVCQYLERVADEPHELGHEPVRYYQLALADASTPPTPVDPSLLVDGRQVSSPLLPLVPVGLEDNRAHLLVRAIFEDIAVGPAISEMTESDRLKVLAELDALPLGMREDIGRYLMDAMREVSGAPEDTTAWRLRRIVGNSREALLAFGACSKPISPMHQDFFAAWVQLRHHELQQITGGRRHLTSVGVLLTPRHDGQRSFDTTMVAASGDLALDEEQLETFREVWSQSRPLI